MSMTKNTMTDENPGLLTKCAEARSMNKQIKLASGEMLPIKSLEFDFKDGAGNHWYYCQTERGLIHTTGKSIYDAPSV